MLGRAAGRDHRDHTLARGNFDLLRDEVERVAHSEVQRILDELDRHDAELLGDILRHIACKLHGDGHRRQVDELDAELHLQRLDELLLRDKAGADEHIAQTLLCLLLHFKRFFQLLVRDDARRDQKIAQTHVRHIHPPPSAICRCMLRSCISGKMRYCYKLFSKNCQ